MTVHALDMIGRGILQTATIRVLDVIFNYYYYIIFLEVSFVYFP